MGIFFGTDGLRGRVNDDLPASVAYRCGNSLGAIYPKSKIIVGTDTRQSASLIMSAFSCGAINAGSIVTSIGVCPTAGVSYLTQKHGFDFGVMISASHNPAEFNGIKIFDKNGIKLGDKREEELEKHFLKETALESEELGSLFFDKNLTNDYKKFLQTSVGCSLDGLKIVLDCSNGASSFFAPEIFEKTGATVKTIADEPNGKNINSGCGSLHLENLKNAVTSLGADVGFAFDGDSDRVIAIDEAGNIVDGDKILYLFATYFKKNQSLNPAIVVGTRHTNMGIEKALNASGIELKRTDIGDKYVSAKLTELNLKIGGEQSGHIIVKDRLCTGDGILNALLIAEILKKEHKKLSSYFDFDIFAQSNINVKVFDKMKVINSELLSSEIEKAEFSLGASGRIMVRVSGTEPFVRIMVESKEKSVSDMIAENLKKVIIEIDKEFEECAE